MLQVAFECLNNCCSIVLFVVCLGGPKIQEECDKYYSRKGRLSVGEVFTSTGGNLKCKKVIHAVGPQYKDLSRDKNNIYLLFVT
jgi:O-acetyl-ADP-ribose deacetylase (regulator of RNase III)